MKHSLSKTAVALVFGVTFFTLSFGVLAGENYLLQSRGERLRESVRLAALAEANHKNNLELTKLHEETVEERAEVLSFVLTQNELIDFISNLEEEAAIQQLVFQTKTITPIELKDELFDEVKVSVTFSGMQEQVFKMVHLLEVLPYHSTVDSVTISNQQNEWKADVVLRLTIATYD